MANLNFQTRIVLFFSTLVVTVQVLTLLAVYWVCKANLVEQIGRNLVYAENIFDRMLMDHGKKIASETRILAADFGFRAAISDSDRATVVSALENLTYRIRGQRGFYIDLHGRIVADTAGHAQGRPFMFPAALRAATAQGETVALGLLDGEFCELAVVPVLAPVPIGWVAIALTVDRGLVEHFKRLSAAPPDVSLIAANAGSVRILISSLAQPSSEFFTENILNASPADYRNPRMVATTQGAFLVLAKPLFAAEEKQDILQVLQTDMSAAFRPYIVLIYAVGGLIVFGLVATLFGAYFLARNIARPVRELAGATQRILEGCHTEPLPVERQDELGRLAETFNTAARIAAEMSDLKAQDRLRRELVASVSHDLRTPLTSLHGYLQTMQLKADNLPEEERRRFLDVAVRQSEKLDRLAQELFELAKLECDITCIRPEPFNILELIQDVTQKYEMLAKSRGLKLQAALNCVPPLVTADIAMIERVLTNLIDNAMKHTAAGGMVTIAVSPGREHVGVSVSDNGRGIAPEYLPNLFERDSPLRQQGGLVAGGLGLLIVAKMLALNGSAIRVESILGKGSVFSFELAVAA